MILVDANVLLYAQDSTCPQHDRARSWWDTLLSGGDDVALCWPVITAFLRIVTHSRIYRQPLSTAEALAVVNRWLTHPTVRLLTPTPEHWRLFQELLTTGQATANLVSDAHLAALAREHGATVASTDADFARFRGLRWVNPLAKA
ncbi:MAG: type II toxin-antitoxin system VapC family toxin [Chthoniobacterales bacterium]|nr:type II toxin-antitoxin system VapC family toxin [Chthoniobacterales bacterium]